MKPASKFYMYQEIAEYPLACFKTFESLSKHVAKNDFDFSNIETLIFTGCGTSLYAAHTMRAFFEEQSSKVCLVENATELFHRAHMMSSRTCLIALSQSGTSTDTILTLKKAKQAGSKVISIVNTKDSPMEKLSDFTLLTEAGIEKAIPSTKAFAAQCIALMMCASVFSLQKDSIISLLENEALLFKSVNVEKIQLPKSIIDFIETVKAKKSLMILGENEFYGLAQEAALKIKETSYIHAEALPLGEVLHGPIAMLSAEIPVLILGKQEDVGLSQKIEKLKATQSPVFFFSLADLDPKMSQKFSTLYPLLFACILHRAAFEIAYQLNLPVDQPRHLVKSVTLGG